MMRISRKMLLTALAALVVVAPRAGATFLPIDSTVAPNAQANPLTGTTILANTGVQNFNVSLNGSSIVGTGQEWVVTGFAGNPFGANDISFIEQIALTSGTNPSGIPAALERVTNSGFGTTFQTDVGFSATGSQVSPTTSDRSINGDVVAFSFLPPSSNIGVGQTSALLIINTNATRFTTTTLTVQDGLTANLNGFGPAVPEPASAALLLATAPALGAWGWLRRRRCDV